MPVERTTATLLEGLETTHRRVGRLLADLPPDAWALPVPATPGWSVADVVSHLAEGDRGALAAAQGREWGEAAFAGGLDGWTAAGVASHAGEDRETRLAAWEAAGDALRWHLASTQEDGWRTRVGFVAGPVSLRTLAQLRLNDGWLHGHDLAGATGQPFGLDEVTLAWMADLAARVIPGSLSRRGRPHRRRPLAAQRRPGAARRPVRHPPLGELRAASFLGARRPGRAGRARTCGPRPCRTPGSPAGPAPAGSRWR